MCVCVCVLHLYTYWLKYNAHHFCVSIEGDRYNPVNWDEVCLKRADSPRGETIQRWAYHHKMFLDNGRHNYTANLYNWFTKKSQALQNQASSL